MPEIIITASDYALDWPETVALMQRTGHSDLLPHLRTAGLADWLGIKEWQAVMQILKFSRQVVVEVIKERSVGGGQPVPIPQLDLPESKAEGLIFAVRLLTLPAIALIVKTLAQKYGPVLARKFRSFISGLRSAKSPTDASAEVESFSKELTPKELQQLETTILDMKPKE